jgi:hypothetical protein
MVTVEERFAAATAYLRRCVSIVEERSIGYVTDPVTGLVEWYVSKTKTQPASNEIARIEMRWLRATTDDQRHQIALDAEALAAHTTQTLPLDGV